MTAESTHKPILLTPPDMPEDMELVMRVMPMPKDANGNGDIFGGWIMSQVDLAGCILPARIARGRVVTVSVNEFSFQSAVSVGDVLSLYARVVRVGRTSITMHVEAWAERSPDNPIVVKVTQANITYVAIDNHGKPRAFGEESPENKQ